MNAAKNKKVMIALAICAICLISAELMISIKVGNEFSKLLHGQKRDSVSKMAHLAYNSIKPILKDVHEGRIDSASARAQIVNLVQNMTYEDEYGENYIFMSSYEGIMLVQPFEPQKMGSDQWDLQDSYGKYIIRELVRAAKEKPKGSFVTYHYYLPQEGRIEEKLSYVIGIPEIGAYIGTGMYMESSYKDLQQVLTYFRWGFLAVSVLIAAAIALYILSLLKANQELIREVREREYAESNIRTVFDSIHDAVIIHKSDGRILLANKGAETLYGLPENQITQYTVQDLSAKGQITKAMLSGAENLNSSSMVFDWIARRPLDGSLFDAEVALRSSKWSGEDVIVAVVRDISERKKYEEEVRYLAYYDSLTSLNNRVYIMNELEKELRRAREYGVCGAVLFMDLDNFKKINDSFGHSFGDDVLIILAEKLKRLNYENILPARIGGDEFVILCYGADAAMAAEIADTVLTEFRNPIALYDNTVNLTCSMGISLYPYDGSTVEDLFKNADLALYSAKYRGKDGYIFYEAAMSDEMQYKSEMEKQLRHAYYHDEFSLHYQPLLDIRQKKIVGHEALIRWERPDQGVVMPNQIIPLAEEIGLIDRIGKWVIDSAFCFAKSVESFGIYISCNVSPVQLSQKDFVENVLERFDHYHLKMGSVALEITESCLIESFDEAIRKLSQLRKKGILICLDDFGTGYSSLNYLKNLPVDYIKIDKSFIGEITNQGKGSNILKTIIILAHEMGIKTVAEGVETEAQLALLEQIGCDLAQGYLISKPGPENRIRKMLEQNDMY